MANGRQRRLAARKRQDTDMMGNPIIDQNFAAMNTNDGADQRSRLLNTQAGFSPSDLTNLVSNDDNDLDEVSFTTKDGAQVQMKNKRGKTEDGQEVTPTINTLGKSYSGGATQANYDMLGKPLGTSYSGGPTFTGYPTPDPVLPTKQASAVTSFIGEDLTQEDTDFAGQGMSTDDFGNVYDQQLNADMLSEQMNRNAFSPEDDRVDMPTSIGQSYSGGATQDPAKLDMMRNGIGQSYSGGATQDPAKLDMMRNGLGKSYSGGATQDPAMLDLMRNGIGKSYSGGATQAPMNTDQFGNPVNDYDEQLMREELESDRLNKLNFAEINDQVVNNAPVQSYTVPEGSPEDLDLQNNPEVIGETLNDNGTVTYQLQNKDNTTQQVAPQDPGMYANVAPGEEVALTPQDAYANTAPNLSNPTDLEMIQAEEDYAARMAENKLQSDMSNEAVAFDEKRGVDPLLSLSNDSDPGRSDKLPPMEPEVIDLSQPEVINSEDLTKNTLDPEVEAEEATNEIMAATAGNTETTAIANDAKKKIEEAKKDVETGAITIDDAKEAITSSLGELGDLLGIDGKDLTRALFRYAGSRIFGSSSNGAAKFAYDGWTTDNSGTALGKNATAKQRNLVAYKAEIAAIDADGTRTAEQKAADKKTANEVFGVNKPQAMGRPVNIKGIVSSTGAEEVVAGRRNESNSYDVFLDGQWVPVEESGLSDIQITGRGAEQAFEKGMKDPRSGSSIDNATYVSSTGVPTFTFKTGDQRKGYQLAKRSVDSFPVIENMLADPKNVEKLTSALGGLQQYAAGNANAKVTAASINLALGDALPQKFKSATSAWLQSLLRADTGAAYSETEIMDYISTNIPQVGDTPDTVAFKIQQMKSTTETMAANSGQGAKYLLGRLDGSVEAPDAVKRMHEMSKGKSTTKRAPELQTALDQY